jgi:uncharacterized membrane protein YdbT with pleckstrin-like domain
MTLDWVPVERHIVKPSLLAAASVFLKVVAVIVLALATPALAAILAGQGAGILATFLALQFAAAGILPLIASIVVPAIRLAFTRYELDEEGVRVHSSVIARSDQRVPWDKVTLLVQSRSLTDRLLGIERLTVIAYGIRGATLSLVGLRDAGPLRDFAAKKMRESASVASLFAND